MHGCTIFSWQSLLLRAESEKKKEKKNAVPARIIIIQTALNCEVNGCTDVLAKKPTKEILSFYTTCTNFVYHLVRDLVDLGSSRCCACRSDNAVVVGTLCLVNKTTRFYPKKEKWKKFQLLFIRESPEL